MLKNLFQQYNKMNFKDVLGPCRLCVRNDTGCIGGYRYKATPKGSIISPIFLAGSKVSWTPEFLEETLVHEMVHMYVTTVLGKKRDGIFGHGRLFRRECRRIRKEHGLVVHIHCFDKENLIKGPKTPWWDRFLTWCIDR